MDIIGRANTTSEGRERYYHSGTSWASKYIRKRESFSS